MNSKSLHVKRRKFKAGDVIFNESDIRDNAYIIETGAVDIIRGHNTDYEINYATLKAGDLFGEMALMEPGLRSASAIARDDTVAFIISSKVLEDRLQGLDPLITSLFSTLIERYRFSRIEGDIDRSDEIYGGAVYQEQSHSES
jgi:CRP-like cAMP-binding protein